MLDYIVPLIIAWLPIFDEYLLFLVAGVVVAFVPSFVYSLLRR